MMKIGINRRQFLRGTAALAAMPLGLRAAQGRDERPNIVFIIADDLGYGDPGCYGQKHIATPTIDRMAAEGMRFTQFYSGSTICAPSRSVLMTGQHTGHTRVRGNMCPVGGSVGYKGKQQVRRMHLTEDDVTIAQVLHKAGYRTGLIDKWHLDGFNPQAGPLDRGFDEFYGWLISAGRTGGYFPAQMCRGREIIDVPGNQNGQRNAYGPDLYTDEAIAFMKKNKDRPFFLCLAHDLPHSPLEVPDLGPYKDKDWPEHVKTYAAMVRQIDLGLGRLMQALKDLQIDDRTVVFFCSDNGPRSEPTKPQTEVAEFFDSNGPLRGYKRDLYEGGIRVPMIVRWPGKARAGAVSELPWYYADLLPTAADLARATPPANIDGVSVAPVLLGQKPDLGDRFLYWEYFESGFQQAVRWRNWKAIRLKRGDPLVLFDLSTDLGEQKNVASEHADVVAKIEDYLKTARTESANWPLTTGD
jgi:arylsulfatase A-like enzyme